MGSQIKLKMTFFYDIYIYMLLIPQQFIFVGSVGSYLQNLTFGFPSEKLFFLPLKSHYPLVNIQTTMENHHFIAG